MARGLTGNLSNLSGLRYFVEVAQAGSFRAASERLHIAASAINRQVKILEEEFGTPLLQRGPGRSGVALTAAGQILLDDVWQAISSLEHARTEIEALRGLRRGTVKLGANEGFANAFLPLFLTNFGKTHPHIAYNVQFDTSMRLLERLAHGDLEMVLAYNAPKLQGVKVVARSEVKTMVVLSRDHPLAMRSQLCVADLAHENILLPSRGLTTRALVDDSFERAGVRPRSIATSNSYIFLGKLASSGLGIAVINMHDRHCQDLDPDAVYIPLNGTGSSPQYLNCCVRAEHTLPPIAEALLEQLVRAVF